MPVDLYPIVMGVFAELTNSVQDFLDACADSSDDEISDDVMERLARAHNAAQDLLEGLGHDKVAN